MLVSSSGGVLIDLLALRPWWSRHQPIWVAERAADTESALRAEDVRWVRRPQRRRPGSLITATVSAARTLRAERPDVVISAGSAVAVPYFVAARALRVPTLWLWTLNLIVTPGLSGSICSRTASEVLLQRQSMRAACRRGVWVGELY
jgi:UDP-N-acetylglucosamine:LPS N-acetylglucosamine transferase